VKSLNEHRPRPCEVCDGEDFAASNRRNVPLSRCKVWVNPLHNRSQRLSAGKHLYAGTTTEVGDWNPLAGGRGDEAAIDPSAVCSE